jgi:catechol 2,3-dioxygenase-like lactoylglutathione lyase family enzyme
MVGDKTACPTIAVKDLATAQQFYTDVLGLTVDQSDEEKQLVVLKSGAGYVQLYVTSMAGTNKATYATWEVDDINAVVAGLKGKGVVFEHYENMPGMELNGDVHTMGNEMAAWFKDPDGNILCVHSKVA